MRVKWFVSGVMATTIALVEAIKVDQMMDTMIGPQTLAMPALAQSGARMSTGALAEVGAGDEGGGGGGDDTQNVTIIDQSRSAFGGGGLGKSIGPGLAAGIAKIFGATFGINGEAA